jgi:hypothetical protein
VTFGWQTFVLSTSLEQDYAKIDLLTKPFTMQAISDTEWYLCIQKMLETHFWGGQFAHILGLMKCLNCSSSFFLLSV